MAGKQNNPSDLEARARRILAGSANRAAKGAPRSKRPGANNSPARQRYWASGRLMEHKVKHLMRFNGMTRAEATTYWLAARQGRKK